MALSFGGVMTHIPTSPSTRAGLVRDSSPLKSLCSVARTEFCGATAFKNSRALGCSLRRPSNSSAMTTAVARPNSIPRATDPQVVESSETDTRPGTILEALDHFRESVDREEELLQEYTVSEEDRPDVAHDQWTGLTDIPVIDLSQTETNRAGLAKQLGAAATEWGFFQLVNHCLPLETLEEVQSQGFKFFELPPEVKQNLGLKANQGRRPYIGDNTIEKRSSLHWAECLMFNMKSLDGNIRTVWPDGNAEFRDSVVKFCTGAEIINEQLLELLAESLGLQSNFFSQHLNSKKTLSLRWNFYPACPRPSDVLGATSHTDGCSLTLLQQDRVGGLQILKDGKWVGIKPIEGALVVNVGDTLHAWTNGLFKSVLHRVVVNEKQHRLSLAAFLNVDSELTVSAPEELVDETHPRLYRAFTPGDYAAHIVNSRILDQTASKDGLTVLEEFKIRR